MVHIVGAGLAGLTAAITLAKAGVACNLIAKTPSERAQSVLAEGGINAALDTMGEHDTVAEHYEDTLKGGVELADPNAVWDLVSHAPAVVRWLRDLGAPFQMEGGRLIQRNFGGQKKKRTAYAQSSTGKVLMTTLIDECRRYEVKGLVRRFCHHEVTALCWEGTGASRRCVGLTFLDSFSGALYRGYGPVILASGGLNGLFPEHTTGTTVNSGDLAAANFVAGVPFANLEFIQFHPTTVAIPNKRLLISEAARGEGGRLFIRRQGEPWYFMEELYPELGNLMPRDVVSREMVAVAARDDCEGPVYLDLTSLSKETWQNKLADMRREIREHFAIDPAKTPVAVSPGIHFFMGGYAVDAEHRCGCSGLWAAGECACQYHGANRLGGNSLLGAVYGGYAAASSLLATGPEQGGGIESVAVLPAEQQRAAVVPPSFAKKTGDILFAGLNIRRDEATLRATLAAVDDLLAAAPNEAAYGRCLLGKAMVLAALHRTESRGAHRRDDHPHRDDAGFRKTSLLRCDGADISVSLAEIPERRRENDL